MPDRDRAAEWIAEDYRFGWRWVLPPRPCGTPRTRGLDDFATAFWHGLGDGDGLMVVDADAAAPPTARELGGLSVLAVVGSRSSVSRWSRKAAAAGATVRRYAMLPAHAPRVIVPLAQASATIRGLALHRPGRRTARVILALASALRRCGSESALARRTLLVAEWHAENARADYALYLGNPGPGRKTIALPLSGPEVGHILKIAQSGAARADLEREAAALTFLSQTPVCGRVPRLLRIGEALGGLTLVQSYHPRHPAPNGFRREIERFLVDLAAIERAPLAELPVVPDGVADDVSAASRCLLARVQALLAGGSAGWVHRAHGDFAPWNVLWSDDGLRVFDWELSCIAPALADASYFAISEGIHVRHDNNAAGTIDRALHSLRRIYAAAGLNGLPPEAYLALFLVSRAGTAPLVDAMLVRFDSHWSGDCQRRC